MTQPPATDEPLTPEHIMQVGLGFWASRTLLSAVELGLFTEVPRGGRPCTQLQTRLGLHPGAVLVSRDAIVSLRFLERTDGVYRNPPAADLRPVKAKTSYDGGTLEIASLRQFG